MERGGAVSPRAVSQPEKQEKTAMPLVIDPEKCIACGTCAQICPDEVFRLEGERGEIPVVMYPDECWHCNACALDCPKHAIELRFPLHYMILKTDAATLNRKAGA